MTNPLLSLALRYEQDVVLARQRARQIAELLGFEPQDCTRISTAVSEIARNALMYAEGGRVEFLLEGEPTEQALVVHVSDTGPGIADLDAVLEGRFASPTGMGLGIQGTRRLMKIFRIESAVGEGTHVWLGRPLPRGQDAVGVAEIGRMAGELAGQRPREPFEELQQQNQEVLRALELLQRRETELTQLNRELEDTNRGVVALYAELDDRLEQLRRSSDLRAQLTSYMSHEFRTPLDSILALSRLLIDEVDGELGEEQAKQAAFIQRSARDLLNMVDDLLDTARMEAGQVVIRPATFAVTDLFSALRATLRPLLTSDSVTLVFEDPAGIPPLSSDEPKLSQILRNFISNALKFTEEGTIQVRASLTGPEQRRVRFTVTDTGLGVAPADQPVIFEDFGQVDGVVQRRRKGTGLGLPLSRKLARLLGGEVYLESRPGEGSTFAVELPLEYESEDVRDEADERIGSE